MVVLRDQLPCLILHVTTGSLCGTRFSLDSRRTSTVRGTKSSRIIRLSILAEDRHEHLVVRKLFIQSPLCFVWITESINSLKERFSVNLAAQYKTCFVVFSLNNRFIF